jgi:methyl-accepting chemotaxis protein
VKASAIPPTGQVASFWPASFATTLRVGAAGSAVAMAIGVAAQILELSRGVVTPLSTAMEAAALLAVALFTGWVALNAGRVSSLAERLLAAERSRAALDVASANIMIADVDLNITYVMPALEKSLAKSRDFWAAKPTPVDVSNLVGKNIDQFHKHPDHNRVMLAKLDKGMTATIAFDGRTFELRVSAIISPQGVKTGYVVEWIEKTEAMRSAHRIAEVITAAKQGDFGARIDVAGLTPETHAVATALYEVYDDVDRYLREIERVMGALAQGDLTQRMDEHQAGLFGAIARSANGAMDRLGELVGRMRETGRAVSASTTEIASGSGELSSRAESQAASLEETAATMEEMAATIRSNADNAQRSNAQAAEASRKAAEGREVVSQAVSAMDLIEKSSERIADITSLIDSIAFQTNLLALNASVEAARAGEAGRGFAVVASEVRTLAQRSAEAAREIKSLIAESSTHVGQGVDLVQRSGKALDSIAGSIAELAESIDEISAASREQSAGVEEITSAVTRMDEITQQNAGLAEQSAAAARTLEGQAAQLAQLVETFRIGRQSGGARPWAVAAE